MQPTDHPAGPWEAPDNRPKLIARTTVTDDGSVQCTLYPVGASEEERLTQWITAGGEWYMDVSSQR